MLQGNLPPTVSEDSLGKLFAKAGAVGTVKIMWRELAAKAIADL